MAEVVNYAQLIEDNYIFYNLHHFYQYASAQYAAGTQYFLDKYHRGLGELRTKALQQQVESIWVQDSKTGEYVRQGLQFFEELDKTQSLQKILDAVASSLNTAIINNTQLNNARSSFSNTLKTTGQYKDLFSKPQVDQQSLNSFFQTINIALQQMGQNPLDPAIINALIGYATSKTMKPGVQVVNSITIQEHKKIFEIIERAIARYHKKGALTPESFQGSITNIFQGTLGEPMAQYLLENAVSSMESEVDDVVIRTLGKNGKLTWDNVGSNRDTAGNTATVDLVNSQAFAIKFNMNGRECNIILDSNISVKWKSSTASSSPIVVQNSTPLSGMLSAMTSVGRYVAENIIAHRSPTNENLESQGASDFSLLRSSIAANYFSEWAMGSSLAFMNRMTSDKNTAQFLMIDGKLYSIYSLIVKSLERYNTSNSDTFRAPFSIQISTNKNLNKWETDGGKVKMKNWEMAKRRSDQTRDIINKLTLTAQFNANFAKTL